MGDAVGGSDGIRGLENAAITRITGIQGKLVGAVPRPDDTIGLQQRIGQ
jgi:hypothetical protein